MRSIEPRVRPIPAVAVLGFTAVRVLVTGGPRVVGDPNSFHRNDFGSDNGAFRVQHDRVFLFGEVPGLDSLSVGLGDRDPGVGVQPGDRGRDGP